MIQFLSQFSSETVAIFVIGISILLSVLCLWVVQRYLQFIHFRDATDHGEIFSAAIGGIISLVFAFVTITVWQNYNYIDNAVAKEANVLHNIYRNVEVYPPEISNQVRPLLRQYVEQVIKVEWPSLREAKEDAESHRLITEVNRIMVAYKPAVLGEFPLHTETLRLISENRGLRHDRIKGSKPHLETPMWTALFIAAILLVAYSSMFVVPRFSTHVFMISSLGASLGIMFYILVVYNYPFTEPGAIVSEPFQRLLDVYWK